MTLISDVIQFDKLTPGVAAGVEQKAKQTEQPIVLRKRRERIKSEANWKMFYYQFARDHSKPNLIWNLKVSTFLLGHAITFIC